MAREKAIEDPQLAGLSVTELGVHRVRLCGPHSDDIYLAAQHSGWPPSPPAVPLHRQEEALRWHLLTNNADYDDLDGGYFVRLDNTARYQDGLVQQIQELSDHVTLKKIVA